MVYEVKVEVEMGLVVEVVQREQEGSSVWLLLSTCFLAGLEVMAASEASLHEVAEVLPVCVFATYRDLRCLPRYLYQVIHEQIVHEVMESQVDFDQEVVDGRSPP